MLGLDQIFWLLLQILNVTTGEAIFTVNPSGQEKPKGNAILLVQGAGKVAEEKRLNVSINYFPTTNSVY
ncbi:hypothetical protein [Lascolabacillus massiliensis]|uniref:hypothetical protein n=1 Tax=Lascolabacillus massiliensis TaxID=1627894 RepID=UPI0012B82151|nr:hypothetical protein [Lascolabacillus massiliensis]